MVELIIFDWDDVITRGSTEGYIKCYHKALESVGVSLDPEEEKKRILAKWGSTAREELRGLLREHQDLLDQAEENYESILMGDTFVDNLSLVNDGIPSLLNRLRRKYALAVATGVNPRLLREKIMPKFNIPPVFSQIESVYDVPDPEKAKPHPYMVERILQIQHASPDKAVLVGDARGDALMAKAAGVTPFVVLTGHLNRHEAEKLDVKYILEDITKVEDVLNSYN